MHFKEYPDCHICILDSKPVLLKALKNAQTFCQKSKIRFDIKNKDVRKILYHFTLSELCNAYTNHKTNYTKIYAEYKFNYIDKNFEKVIQKVFKVLPVPYCRVIDIDHPDTKYSAINVLNKNNSTYQTLKKFADKNKLTKIQEKLFKQNIFLGGTVDFSRSLE